MPIKFHAMAQKLIVPFALGLVFAFSINANGQDKPNVTESPQITASTLLEKLEEVRQSAIYENGKIVSFKITPVGEAKPIKVRMEYDEPSRAVSIITEKNGRTRVIRDNSGRISKYELPDGGSVRINYDNIQGDLPFVQSADFSFPNGKTKRVNLPRLPSTYRKISLNSIQVRCPREAAEAAALSAAAVVACANGFTPELCATTTAGAAFAIAKWYACERENDPIDTGPVS
jgi:hypothetical protein